MSIQTETLARTVWWCWILNEPMIMHWKDNKPHCSTCDMVDEHPLENGSILHQISVQNIVLFVRSTSR
jgi:hypothetical protein